MSDNAKEEILRKALEKISALKPTNDKISGNPGSLWGTICQMREIADEALKLANIGSKTE